MRPRTTFASSSVFLSTPSARRATRNPRVVRQKRGHFYLRPPRGGRPAVGWFCFCTFSFLSTPSARRATCAEPLWPEPILFLSTPSARRATQGQRSSHCGHRISIHALREEGDGRLGSCRGGGRNFYPRPPRGGRRLLFYLPEFGGKISIHALREEGDSISSPPRF